MTQFTLKRLFVVTFYVALALGIWKLTGYPDFGSPHKSDAAYVTGMILIILTALVGIAAALWIGYHILFILCYLWEWSKKNPRSYAQFKCDWDVFCFLLLP